MLSMGLAWLNILSQQVIFCRAAFDSLTEAAGELLGAGDASVYSKDKEALVRDIQRDMVRPCLAHQSTV